MKIGLKLFSCTGKEVFDKGIISALLQTREKPPFCKEKLTIFTIVGRI